MPRAKPKVADEIDDEPGSPAITESRNKRKKKISRLEEYDEDPGRDRSRTYQRLADMLENCTVREAEKSKAYLREFRREMEKHDEELKVFRQKKGEEFAKNQEKSAATFKKLSCELPDGKGGRLVVQRQQDHPLFKQAEAIMEDHQSLLKQFQLVEEQLDAKKLDLPVSRWEQDNREIRELLAYSGKYGEDLVGSVLAPERVATPFDPSCTDETQRVLKELFKDSQGALDGETWGQVAEEQLKQFSIVARTARLGERW